MSRYLINDENGEERTVIGDAAEILSKYPDAQYMGEDPEPTLPRRITVGAFFDRFKDLKWAILSSTDETIKALIFDCSVRQFIDLDRPDLEAALEMLVTKGFAVDIEYILYSEIQPGERP